MGVFMLFQILVAIIYLYIYCCYNCANALSVPNVPHNLDLTQSIVASPSNGPNLYSSSLLPTTIIATSVSSVLNNNYHHHHHHIDRSASIYTYDDQDRYHDDDDDDDESPAAQINRKDSSLKSLDTQHGNAYFSHNSIEADKNEDVSREPEDNDNREELEKIEMFTNNHQQQQQQPAMTTMTTTTAMMTAIPNHSGHSNNNNNNNNNGHNSRHYNTHYQLASAGGSNLFNNPLNAGLYNGGGGSNNNKFLASANNPGNNLNLNYIHSLLLKPTSSSAYGLQSLVQNQGYSSSASSSPSSSPSSSSQSSPSSSSSAAVAASNSLSSYALLSPPKHNHHHHNHHHYHGSQQQLGYEQQNLTTKFTNQISDFSGSSICGKQQVGGSREPRIVGGNNTYEGEFPWAVSIQRHGNHHCGGVIVGKRWILTAAHCVRSQLVSNLIVRTGGHTLSRSINHINSNLEQDYFVDQIIMHGDFSRYDNLTASQMKSSANTNNADIALLRLKHDIHWNELAWPVCFPNREAGNFSGHDAIVIGWGKLNEKSEDFSNELQKVKLTIIDNKVCQNWFRQAGREMPIDDRIICAGFKNGGKDACHGDSGGPLLSKIDGHYVVVGVVSTGIGCARPLLPGLYSRVSSYISWIERYVS